MGDFDQDINRSDASALIPEEVASEIIQALPKQSAALSMFRRVTMSRKQKRLPVLSVLPMAYFRTAGLRKTTELRWANKYLEAEELSAIVPIDKAVLDDSEFDIWGEAKPRIVESLGATIDGAALFGTGKPATWPEAIVPAAIAANNKYVRGSVNGQDLAEDINQVMVKVEEDGFDVNGFMARKRIKGSLRGLRDSNNGLLFQPSLQAGTPSTLYGEALHYVDNGAWENDLAELIAGDQQQGIIGLRQDLSWEIWKEAVIQDDEGRIVYNLAQMGMVALVVVMRVAFQVANPITRMNQDADRYPFAVLQPGA